MTDLLRIRRGLGVIYLLSGLLHWAVMTMAALYSLGRISVVIGVGLWSELYYAHFLFLILASLAYLALSYRQTGIFYYEALVDFLIGIGAFVVLLSVAAVVLYKGLVTPWLSLVPGTFLVAYGAGLYFGRPMGFGPGSAPPR